jgi:uncharacterized membrane protein
MKNKNVGIILISVALVIGLIVYLFNRALKNIVNTSCDHGPTCPMWGSISFHTNLSLIFFIIILGIGVFLYFFKEDSIKTPVNKTINTKDLNEDEMKIFNLILEEKTIFQSLIVEQTGFTKVKVTRLLDKLEGKQLIERKRRGMTNVIILK